MALSFEDPASWLPNEFLAQEKLLMDEENIAGENDLSTEFKPGFCFPTEFPYEFDSLPSPSPLNSPLESATETESSSDEDDFLAGLSRRLTHQLAVNPEKTWVMAGSPESTMSGIGSWSVSSNESPNGVLSPPTTPFGAGKDTWALTYAAAGQVARLKMNSNEGNINKYCGIQGSRLLGPLGTQIPAATAVKSHNPSGFDSGRTTFGHNVRQMSQYHNHVRQENMMLKPQSQSSVWEREQMMTPWQVQQQHQLQQQIQSRRNVVYQNGSSLWPSPGLPQSASLTLQMQRNPQHQHRHHHQQQAHHTGSDMRAFLLGGSAVKRESAGTGVFLPRRYGSLSNSKKKSSIPTACSTFLHPGKLTHPLNLEFDGMNMNASACTGVNGTYLSEYDVLMARRNALFAQQKGSLRQEGVVNQEMRLPQEWTY